MLVSIIVPAYKQEKTIKEDITRIWETMKNTRFDYEVIVVVDGFLDKTFQEAEKINKPNVKVVGYETNKGKGYAVRYGMARAGGEYVAFIDAGMEIDPNGVSMIMEHMIWYDADIIVASKRHPASKVNFPPLRRLYSWGYHTLVSILFRLPVTDTQVGLKVFKRKVLEEVLPRLVVKKYAFDIELLAVAKYLGYKRIFEAPVFISFDFDSGSRFTKFMFLDPFIRNMFVDTFGVFYRMYLLGYYHPKSKRKWVYDKELEMRVNTGELSRA
jgi:dolichol-phosphate mannosyltransferase